MRESNVCFLCQQSNESGIAISYRFVCSFCMDALWLSNADKENEWKWPSIDEWRNILELDSFHYQTFGLPLGGGGSGIKEKKFLATSTQEGAIHYFMNFTDEGEWRQKEIFLNKKGEIDMDSVREFTQGI